MSPEFLAVALRPRNGWEAVDLGFQLARHCSRALFVPVTMLVLGLAVLILGVRESFEGMGFAVMGGLLWWLKPVVDRLSLHVLSHAVFGEQVRWQDALRALPGILRDSRLLAALTWRRLDPYRSLCLPVDQLEGMQGKPAAARRRLLSQRVGSHAVGLLFCVSLFEMVLLGAAITMLVWVLPEEIEIGQGMLDVLFSGDEVEPIFHMMVLVLYALVIAVLEPFYVAAGFGLYLKRRTDLEAWDVELQLRRTAAPRVTGAKAMQIAALGLALLASGGWVAPPESFAQQAETAEAAGAAGAVEAAPPAVAPPPPSARELKMQRAPAEIREVLKNPDFGQETTKKELRMKEKKQEKKSDMPAWLESLIKFLRSLAEIFAGSFRFIGWIVLGVLGLWLAIFLLRQLDLRRRQRLPAPPARLAGLDIRPDSLPDDIVAAVRALLARKQLREALALLYRASLSRFAHQEHIQFEPGDTEGDCLRRVTQAASPAHPYFARLTGAWQQVAYARRAIVSDEAEALCVGWQTHFGRTA